ncbi:MAG: hypothetical protein SF097_18165 [Acidobacteriota bacterium]|nr:hypothetical protein [Acidobacteriota bacterium]
MTITIKLENLALKIILVVAGLFLVFWCGRTVFGHFLLRNVADRRIVMSRDVLTSAAIRNPNSSRILQRLADAEFEESASEPQRLLNAQALALKAVSLSPWDYKNWRLLGMAQDADGKLEEAERAMKVAAVLAPSNSETHWALANLLVRQNNRIGALRPFRVATRFNNELLPAAMDVVWQAFDGDVEALNSFVNKETAPRLLMAQFLLEQAQADAAIEVFQGLDSEARLNSQNAALFISLLVQAGRSSEARQLWGELVGDSLRSLSQEKQESSLSLVWNGSFEHSAPKNFGHFDWTLRPSEYARIGFDRSVFRSGQKSLRLNFVGRETTKLMGDIQQMVVLNPNRKYRLECFAKTANFVTPEGPRIALLGQKGILVVSEPVAAGEADWQRLVVEFTSPSDGVTAQVAIIKIPRFDYEEPTKGTVWFDDFRLTEL